MSKFGIAFLFLFTIGCLTFGWMLGGVIFMWCWNAVLAAKFGQPTLTWIDGVLILILLSIIGQIMKGVTYTYTKK